MPQSPKRKDMLSHSTDLRSVHTIWFLKAVYQTVTTMALMVAEDDFRVQPDIECEDAGHWQPRTKQLQALLYLVVDNDFQQGWQEKQCRQTSSEIKCLLLSADSKRMYTDSRRQAGVECRLKGWRWSLVRKAGSRLSCQGVFKEIVYLTDALAAMWTVGRLILAELHEATKDWSCTRHWPSRHHLTVGEME